jgi:lipopolysaccharide/colanic/teichoic acid biosynthesis glycosyltransferase
MLKRAFDITAALIGLVVLTPLLLLIALLIRLQMGSPVLFRQRRPGLGGKLFTMLKFRTMRSECDADGRLLPDAQRLTPLGSLLRKTSLDELPELVNVLRGDMSLVGPRPLLDRYLPYYTSRERKRHEMRPGITGLAQVSGRNTLPWNERLEIDARYVENWSLLLDLTVLLKTIGCVFRARGIEVTPLTLRDLDVERAQQPAGNLPWK